MDAVLVESLPAMADLDNFTRIVFAALSPGGRAVVLGITPAPISTIPLLNMRSAITPGPALVHERLVARGFVAEEPPEQISTGDPVRWMATLLETCEPRVTVSLHPTWTPACTARRIILHWTAGGYRATAVDNQHYHILIEGDGTLVRGDHSIEANSTQGPRASHTLNCNTHSIGVAMCCMAGARERPFDPGLFPVTQHQWQVMVDVTAQLCDHYVIDVTSQTVLAR